MVMFVQKLRDYVLHYRMPDVASVMEFGESAEGGGSQSVKIKLCLNKEELLEWGSWNSKAIGFLKSAKSKLDLVAIIDAYHDKVIRFYGWYYERLHTIHKAERELIAKYLTLINESSCIDISSGVRARWNLNEPKSLAALEESFSSILAPGEWRKLEQCSKDNSLIRWDLIIGLLHTKGCRDLSFIRELRGRVSSYLDTTIAKGWLAASLEPDTKAFSA